MPPALWEGHADQLRYVRTPEGQLLQVRYSPESADLMLEHKRLGAEWFDEVLDRRPEIRLAMPGVLGLAPPPPDAERFDVPAAHALARVFVPTQAHARAVRTLGEHRFCVLTGPPEMGKTAIARVIALARAVEAWEAIECSRPDDLLRAFEPRRPQVFVADDAFGSTEFRPETAERWARDLPSILRRLHEAPDHWLIWTSRPTPLAAGLERVHREEGLERFPRPGDVLVDASGLQLDEKALILLRHGLAAELPRKVRGALRAEGPAIVEHPHFTPERIRRLVAGLPRTPGEWKRRRVRLAAVAARQLAEPTEAMAVSLAALEPGQRALLVAMLDQPPGPVAERDLAHTVRTMFPGVEQRAPADDVERLTDHFLRRTGARVEWVHPSWRDLVIDRLAGDAVMRRAFLRGCGAEGFALALSTSGGAAGERMFPMLVDDADFDAAADRVGPLARELAEDELAALLRALARALELVQYDGAERLHTELRALSKLALAACRRREPIGPEAMSAWLHLSEVAEVDEVVPQEAPEPVRPPVPPALRVTASEDTVAAPAAWTPSFDVGRVLDDLA